MKHPSVAAVFVQPGSHSLQLGGRILDLDAGRAGGAGDIETIGEGMLELRLMFGTRAGLRVTFIVVKPHRVQIIVWRCSVGKFEFIAETRDLADSWNYASGPELFDAVEAYITQYAFERLSP